MTAAPAADIAATEPAPQLSVRVRHLLDVAREAFVKEGFDGTSIDAIALEAGVSKETIYRHFPDKPALFRAALEDLAGRFARRAATIGGGQGHALEDLARAILDAAVEGGLLSPLWLAAGLAGRMPAFARELQQGQWVQLEPVRAALADHARAQGIATEVPIALALDFGSLSVEGPALLLGFTPPPPELREAIAMRVAALFSGGLASLTADGAVLGRDEARPVDAAAPPASDTLRRILGVAAELFVTRGYEATTLAEIRVAAQAGRGTLYRHFGSKEGLFRAAMRQRAAEVMAEARVPDLLADAEAAGLARYLLAAIDNLASPRSIDLHRCAISASRRDPDLARTLHDALRRPWLDPLAAWIAARTGLPDARWLARQALVLALQGSRLFASGARLGAAEGERQARVSAAILLHGYCRALVHELPVDALHELPPAS